MKTVKSLLISSDVPTDGYGTGQRLLSLQRALETLGECRFLWLHPEPKPERPPGVHYTAPIGLPAQPSRGFWLRRHLTFREFRPWPPARAAMEEVRKEYPFDLAVCSFFRSTGAAPDHLSPCLLDADCLPEPGGLLTRLLWPATRAMMKRRARRFRKVFVIRRSDADVLDGVGTVLLPCISATAGPPLRPDDDASNLLFVGSTKWGPNREAVEFLAGSVAPAIRSAGLPFTVRLVGSGTEAWAGAPGVSAGGFVKDLLAEYRRAAVVLCPVWTGGGANVKLAEALQYGSAIVASAHAAKGFEGILEAGTHALIEADRDAYVRTLEALLRDPARRASLRENAGRLASAALSQDAFTRIVRDTVTEVLG